MISTPGELINAELTPPSMLIGRKVSEIQRPMAFVRPLAGGSSRSKLNIAPPMN